TEDGQVGARGLGLLVGGEDAGDVALEVPDDDVELAAGDTDARHAASVRGGAIAAVRGTHWSRDDDPADRRLVGGRAVSVASARRRVAAAARRGPPGPPRTAGGRSWPARRARRDPRREPVPGPGVSH